MERSQVFSGASNEELEVAQDLASILQKVTNGQGSGQTTGEASVGVSGGPTSFESYGAPLAGNAILGSLVLSQLGQQQKQQNEGKEMIVNSDLKNSGESGLSSPNLKTSLKAMPQLNKTRKSSATSKERRSSAMSLASQASDYSVDTNGEMPTAKRRSRAKSSNYRGVSRCAKDGRWQARIRIGRSVKYLGRFKTEADAARRYDIAAKRYHGVRAVVNFLDSQEAHYTAEDMEFESKLADEVSAQQAAAAALKHGLSNPANLPPLVPNSANSPPPPRKKQRRATALSRPPLTSTAPAATQRRNSLPPSIPDNNSQAAFQQLLAHLELIGRANAARDSSSPVPHTQQQEQQHQKEIERTNSVYPWQSLLGNHSKSLLLGLTAGMLGGSANLSSFDSNPLSIQTQKQNEQQQETVMSPVSRMLAAKKISTDMSGAVSGLISLNGSAGIS